MSRICPKCGYRRGGEEPTAEFECPRCHIIYDKYMELHDGPGRRLPDRSASARTDTTRPRKTAPVGALALLFAALIGVTLAIPALRGGKHNAAQAHLIGHVADADFADRVLRVPGPVLVDFWAPWCRPCGELGRSLLEVAPDFAARLPILKLNVDENPQTARRYGVRSIPTLILFRDGSPVARHKGSVPTAELRAWIEDETR